ncbi:MAG: hypothetical protein R3217_07885 [Gammaproteobacteria bacterium]|nr:hypothetical protein [Gammaproteobacteria bacterium]
MKKLILGFTAAFALFGMTSAAHAIDTDFGVKAGQYSVDGDDTAATTAGLVYTLDLVGIVGVEFEANTTLSDGDFGGVDYSATQLGAYGVLMTPGPIYFKGKAGFNYADIDIGGVSDNDSNLAYGIGVGAFGFELEYTRTEFNEADVDFLSLSFKF